MNLIIGSISTAAKNAVFALFALLALCLAAAPALSNTAYYNLSSSNLVFRLTAGTGGMITQNDNWSNVPSVEGYCGNGLAGTYGVDPRTIVATEFAPNMHLPTSASTCVAANKGNPSAYNAGGLAEFDTGNYLAIGFQGNVQARAPYMVFYLNATGESNVKFSFDAMDIDGGSNNSVSQIAVQYRIGESGNFIDIPSGYIADATQPNVAGLVTTRNIVLPPAVDNQPQVQVRIITTDAAAPDGTSSPDEWIGVNNITAGNHAPTAAGVSVSGRVLNAAGRPIKGASVTLWDDRGQPRQTTSSSLGFYSFDDLEVNHAYVMSVFSTRHVFSSATRFVTVTGAMSDLDFIADGLPAPVESGPDAAIVESSVVLPSVVFTPVPELGLPRSKKKRQR
jgi:hypothetical protein